MDKERKEKLLHELKEIQKTLKLVVSDAWIDAETCFHEKPDYIIGYDHMRLLCKIAGEEAKHV